MKKTAPFLLSAFITCISFLNMHAANDLQLNSLSDNNYPFTLKHAKSDSDDDGVKGKIMVTAGAGVNLLGLTLEARYIVHGLDENVNNHRSSPLFNASVDYGFGKKFSAGVGLGYQTVRINFQDVITAGDHYYDSWKRINLTVRGDYYIVAKEDINLYTGLRVGYNLYTVSTTIPETAYPNYIDNLDIHPTPLSLQAHFGISYFFNGHIGLNAEIGAGVGVPYLFNAGIAIKI